MKTSLSNEADGIGSELLLEFGGSILRHIFPSMLYFARTTNNVKDESVAGRYSSSSSSTISNNMDLIKFQNYVEFIY